MNNQIIRNQIQSSIDPKYFFVSFISASIPVLASAIHMQLMLKAGFSTQGYFTEFSGYLALLSLYTASLRVVCLILLVCVFILYLKDRSFVVMFSVLSGLLLGGILLYAFVLELIGLF